MANAKLLSAAGAAVILTVAVSPLPATVSNQFRADPHDVYLNCLMTSYEAEHPGADGPILKAYRACQPIEQNYRIHLIDTGIKPDRVGWLVERVNEVAYARYRGLGLEDTKGCLRIALNSKPLS